MGVGFVVVDILGIATCWRGRMRNRCMLLAHFVLTIIAAEAVLGLLALSALYGRIYYAYQSSNYISLNSVAHRAVIYCVIVALVTLPHCAWLRAWRMR